VIRTLRLGVALALVATLAGGCAETSGAVRPVAPHHVLADTGTGIGPRPGGGSGGGGSGTVTSVAATAGGLLAVAGTPTVAPTVGIASLAASSLIGNATGGGAVPTAIGLGTGVSFSGSNLIASNVPLTAIATEADQTILGNGSGGVAAPVALTISAATGLVAAAGTLKNTLTQGVAGGQTIIGGTVTTQNLTVSPNAADTTTGRVLFNGIGLSFNNSGTAGAPTINWGTAGTGIYGTSTLTRFSSGGATSSEFGSNYVQVFGTTSGTGYYIGSMAAGLFVDGASGIYLAVNNFATHRLNISSTGAFQFVNTPSIAFQAAQMGFFSAALVSQQTVGANVNNVAASGTTGQFDDFTSLAVYATDAAAIHADIYQLSRSVAQLTVSMRNLGLGN
jgi:hypothetical protein